MADLNLEKTRGVTIYKKGIRTTNKTTKELANKYENQFSDMKLKFSIVLFLFFFLNLLELIFEKNAGWFFHWNRTVLFFNME